MIDDRFVLSKFAVLVRVANDLYLLAVLVVRIGEIDVAVLGEVRMERDVHQTAFAGRFDIGDGEDWVRLQLAFLDDADATLSLGKEHVAIREPREPPRHLETARDGLDAKFDAILLRRVGLIGSLSAILLAAS